MNLTTQQREELRAVLMDRLPMDDVEAVTEASQAIEEWLRRITWQPKKPVKYGMRTDAVWTMQILMTGPMTTKEIADVKVKAGLDPLYAKDMTRHVGELRYWNLVQDTGLRRGGCVVWMITSDGRDFVNGKCRVPSHLFTEHGRRVSAPAGEFDGIPIWVWEIKPQDFSELQHDWVRRHERSVAEYQPPLLA